MSYAGVDEVKRRLLDLKEDITTRDDVINDILADVEGNVKTKLTNNTITLPTYEELMAKTAALASMDITTQMDDPDGLGRRLLVDVEDGGDGTGEVKIEGVVNGRTIKETITFTGNGEKRTLNLFSSVTLSEGITTTGLIDESPIPTVAVYQDVPEPVRSAVIGWTAGLFFEYLDRNIKESERVGIGPTLIKQAQIDLAAYIKHVLIQPKSRDRLILGCRGKA